MAILIPFYGWGNWGPKTLSQLSRVTQLIANRGKNKTQAADVQSVLVNISFCCLWWRWLGGGGHPGGRKHGTVSFLTAVISTSFPIIFRHFNFKLSLSFTHLLWSCPLLETGLIYILKMPGSCRRTTVMMSAVQPLPACLTTEAVVWA